MTNAGSNMVTQNRLVLDLKKSAGIVRAGGGGQEKRWTRFPGAASMFNARDAEAKETQRLMSEMPTPKLAISDGNFTSPDDGVKGLPLPPAAPQGGAGHHAAGRTPAVDAAELTELPDDTQLLQNKIHAMHEELKACQGPITGNAALIHMHNDLKAQMRSAYKDPNPEVVAEIDHKIHHFKKLLEGPPEPEPDPNDPNAMQGAGGPQQPGQP